MSRKLLRLLGIIFTLTLIQFSLVEASAETRSQMKLVGQSALEFKPPSRGAPGDRKDSGSRNPSGCSNIVAMIPTTNLGLTASARPTFWLYLPESATPGDLTLTLLENKEDGAQEVVYRTKFYITNSSGIASFRLPEAAPPLQIGKQYRWIFSCGAIARYGSIERVALTPEIERQLTQATPRERILIWAENGFWYETLTELAALHYAHPQDAQLAADWSNLLRNPAVGLDDLVSKPLAQCCLPEKENVLGFDSRSQHRSY